MFLIFYSGRGCDNAAGTETNRRFCDGNRKSLIRLQSGRNGYAGTAAGAARHNQAALATLEIKARNCRDCIERRLLIKN